MCCRAVPSNGIWVPQGYAPHFSHDPEALSIPEHAPTRITAHLANANWVRRFRSGPPGLLSLPAYPPGLSIPCRLRPSWDRRGSWPFGCGYPFPPFGCLGVFACEHAEQSEANYPAMGSPSFPLRNPAPNRPRPGSEFQSVEVGRRHGGQGTQAPDNKPPRGRVPRLLCSSAPPSRPAYSAAYAHLGPAWFVGRSGVGTPSPLWLTRCTSHPPCWGFLDASTPSSLRPITRRRVPPTSPLRIPAPNRPAPEASSRARRSGAGTGGRGTSKPDNRPPRGRVPCLLCPRVRGTTPCVQALEGSRVPRARGTTP